jgi:hypothetical protein
MVAVSFAGHYVFKFRSKAACPVFKPSSLAFPMGGAASSHLL